MENKQNKSKKEARNEYLRDRFLRLTPKDPFMEALLKKNKDSKHTLKSKDNNKLPSQFRPQIGA